VRTAFRVVLFAGLSAAATIYLGWWAVPALAAIWVRAFPAARHPVRTAAAGAALGWGAILLWGAAHGPVPALAARMSTVLSLPRGGFLAATLVWPALLAGAAALLVKPSRG
jgi:hypothetical protein